MNALRHWIKSYLAWRFAKRIEYLKQPRDIRPEDLELIVRWIMRGDKAYLDAACQGRRPSARDAQRQAIALADRDYAAFGGAKLH